MLASSMAAKTINKRILMKAIILSITGGGESSGGEELLEVGKCKFWKEIFNVCISILLRNTCFLSFFGIAPRQ